VQDRNSFLLKLEDTENWLYEEGEDLSKQVYTDKLAELKVRPHAFHGLYVQVGASCGWTDVDSLCKCYGRKSLLFFSMLFTFVNFQLFIFSIYFIF
jgi:hypothetical protein